MSLETILDLPCSLQGWVDGPPVMRDDGASAIVVLTPDVQVDGQDHYGLPVIVTRWSGKLKTTACSHRFDYDAVVRHIDIAVD